MGKEKIKILHIVDNLKFGGAQELILNLTKGVDKNKFSIDVACLRWGKLGDEIKRYAANVFALGEKKYNLSIPSSLLKIIRNGHYDIIHLQLEVSTILGSLLGRLGNVSKIVTTVSCHRAQISSRRYYATFWMPSLFIDKYIVWSNTIHKELKAINIPTCKITFINQGVNGHTATRSNENDSIRNELKLDNNIPVILSIARLSKERRLDIFIKGMKLVTERIPEAKLLLVGSGHEEIALKNLAKEIGITDNVIFLGERRDLENLYPGCDVYITVSIDEEIGVAGKLAMTYAKPVIAFNDGNMDKKEILEKTGFLIAVKNEDELASELIELLTHPEKRKLLGLKAKRFVEENFSLESFVKKHEEFYMGLMTE